MPVARLWPFLIAGLVLLPSACGADDDRAAFLADEVAASEETPPPPSERPPTTTATTSTTTTVTTTTPPLEPEFTASIELPTADDLGVSWRAGCPVAVEDLRWIELSHWDDQGRSVDGPLVVHADHADDIVAAFERLFDARFPVHSMRPITEFDGDDNASMSANNTSAFNCREIAGRPGVWSQHAYGGAIDINPLVNPWVRGSRVDPPEAAVFVDRDASVTGLIVAGDVVTEAFADIGWGWGGDWTNTLDYQHFSHNGR